MIHADGGDHADFRIFDDIRGIKAASQPDFKDDDIAGFLFKIEKSHCGLKLKRRWINLFFFQNIGGFFHFLRQSDQALLINLLACRPDPLCKMFNIWRCE